jgi:hypothetical protein
VPRFVGDAELLFDGGHIKNVVSPEFKLEMATDTAPRSTTIAVLNNRPSCTSISPMTIIGPVFGSRFSTARMRVT